MPVRGEHTQRHHTHTARCDRYDAHGHARTHEERGWRRLHDSSGSSRTRVANRTTNHRNTAAAFSLLPPNKVQYEWRKARLAYRPPPHPSRAVTLRRLSDHRNADRPPLPPERRHQAAATHTQQASQDPCALFLCTQQRGVPHRNRLCGLKRVERRYQKAVQGGDAAGVSRSAGGFCAQSARYKGCVFCVCAFVGQRGSTHQ